MPPTITPILNDPRTYVENKGIVEIHYGVENSSVEWQTDLHDYVRNDMREGERFEMDFCTKNKETGKRYWFACIVCPCTLYRDENLVHHVKGQRHQKRAIEKLNSENNVNRKRKRNDSEPLNEVFNPVPGHSRSSRSDLQHRLMHGPSYPFLGLDYITEYVNPGNPNKDPMYTCSLDGCKSAWGSASEMYNHLTSSKNKHNRNYLQKFYEIPNLTVDQIFNKSRQVFDEKKEKNNEQVEFHIKQISNRSDYSELKNRPLTWSEKNDRRKKEKPQSDLQHYKMPTKEEKAKNTFEAFDTLQTQMQLCLEQLQNPMTTESFVEKLKMLMDRSIYQCDVMFAIFSRNSSLMTETRIEQTRERHRDLTAQYRNYEQMLEMNRQSNDIARHFTHNIIYEERDFQEEKEEMKEKKSKLDNKKPKIDVKCLAAFTELGDSSAFGNEIGSALEISTQKLANQDMKDLFKDKVNQCVKEYVDVKGYTPTRDQIEKITEKISNSEIQIWTKNNLTDSNQFRWSSFQFTEKHKQNVKGYLDQKFGKRK